MLDVAEIQTFEHDVLVIGAGGAGLRAAIECSARGLSTGLMCKSLLGKAHTVMAEGGVAAALGNVDGRDNWKVHFRDTMRGGKFLNQWRMAELHAREAPDRVRELEEWGAVFDRTRDGLISQRNFGGHRYPRLAHVGDGYAMAYEAGADLMDMEFTQFHPTGMVWPPSVRGILVTEGVRGDGGVLLNSARKRFMFDYIPEKFASETAASEEEANRWLKGDKTARRPPELLTRDVVARAITREVNEGRGSPHGGVFLDIASRVRGETIKKKLPSMYHQFKELAEVDITREPMEVGPTLHYFMGGIRVDSDTQMSTVPGLFAAGEAAAGMHGANRLGGNSLSDLLVFGRLSGIGAAQYDKGLGAVPRVHEDEVRAAVRGATDILNRESGTNPYVVHEQLQEIMGRYVGIVRAESELRTALEELEKLKAEAAKVKAAGAAQYNAGWHEALDLKSLLITAEAVTRAALVRQESRGAHTRVDYPGERDEWQKANVVVLRGGDGRMETRVVDRQEPPKELAAIAFAKIEDLEAGRA